LNVEHCEHATLDVVLRKKKYYHYKKKSIIGAINLTKIEQH